MEKKKQILYFGGMLCGRTALANMIAQCEELKPAFEELGESLKTISVGLKGFDIEKAKTNQKWYNQFPNKRRKK